MELPRAELIEPWDPVWDDRAYIDQIGEWRVSAENAVLCEQETIAGLERLRRGEPREEDIVLTRVYGVSYDEAIKRARGNLRESQRQTELFVGAERDWREREDFIAELTFLKNGLQSSTSDSIIRELARLHLDDVGITQLTDDWQEEDFESVTRALARLARQANRSAKRRNLDIRTRLYLDSDGTGAVWIVLEREIDPSIPVVDTKTILKTVIGPRPARIRRFRGARARGSRRSAAVRRRGRAKAAARGGGDPPGGSSGDGGSDPPPAAAPGSPPRPWLQVANQPPQGNSAVGCSPCWPHSSRWVAR
jgi:hypothetical protein